MIFKVIQCAGQEHNGIAFDSGVTVLDDVLDLEKRASIAMPDDMVDFWNKYPKKYTDKFLFVRINALGAGEYWGSNLNGDYFPEKALIKNHKTFQQAYMFLHHDNDDPKKSIGKVIFATYNDDPDAKRVEVIVAIDRKNPRAEKTISNIENGSGINVSMGCKVPFDRCSVCGNIASTRRDYCEHLKFKMNKLLPDGIRVNAVNDEPAFFDLSDVTIPADPQSGFIEKIAGVMSSAELAEKYHLEEKMAAREKAEDKEKHSTIEKTGPDDEGKEVEIKEDIESPEDITERTDELEETGKILDEQSENLPESILDRLSNFPMSEVMGTTGAMGIKLKPVEYTYISIRKTSSEPHARLAYRNNCVFEPTEASKESAFRIPEDINPKIARILYPWLEKRSFYPAFAERRLTDTVTGVNRELPSEEFLSYPQAAAKYAAYVRDVSNISVVKLACILRNYDDIRTRIMDEHGQFLKLASSGRRNLTRNIQMARLMLRGSFNV